MNHLETVRTERAPAAIGPYSQAVRAGGFLFSAGQIGLEPASGELAANDVVGQARQVLRNLAAVLEAAGAGFGDVVRTTVYLADMDDFAAVNAVYAEHFTAPFPARSTVAAAGLPKGARVEIDLIARLP
ncbi:MAG: RidA family protein [Gemmatimonadota bacterium]|nr:RidA family protein [Gemmatimonadota bacterium]